MKTRNFYRIHKSFCGHREWNFWNGKSAQYSIASLTGTFVYRDFISELTNSSLGLRTVSFQKIFMVKVLILHSGPRKRAKQLSACQSDDMHNQILIKPVSWRSLFLPIFSSPYSLRSWLTVGLDLYRSKVIALLTYKSYRIPMILSSSFSTGMTYAYSLVKYNTNIIYFHSVASLKVFV